MREELGIEPSDSLAIYQLSGALLIIPLRSLHSGTSQRTLEAMLSIQD